METISRSIPVKRPYKLPFESNKWGGAYFDGGNATIQCPNINLSGSEITVMAWFKGPQAWSVIRQQVGDYIVLCWNPTTNRFHLLSNDGGVVGLDSGNLSDNVIHHICFTWKQNTVNGFQTFKDGILVAQRNSTNTPIANIGNNIYIGTFNGVAGESTIGIIYDAIIIKQFLTQSQIQDIIYGRILPTQFDCRLWHDYRLGHARDLSGNGNHGTINGNVRFV